LDFDNDELLVCSKDDQDISNRDRTQGWSLDWMHKNPMSKKTWDINEECVQKKVLDMIRRSKPEYIEMKTEEDGENAKKLNDFLSAMCVIQKGQW